MAALGEAGSPGALHEGEREEREMAARLQMLVDMGTPHDVLTEMGFRDSDVPEPTRITPADLKELADELAGLEELTAETADPSGDSIRITHETESAEQPRVWTRRPATYYQQGYITAGEATQESERELRQKEPESPFDEDAAAADGAVTR